MIWLFSLLTAGSLSAGGAIKANGSSIKLKARTLNNATSEVSTGE
jgi:hypothetical protein